MFFLLCLNPFLEKHHPEAEQDAALIHLLVERSKKKGGYENVGQNPSLSQFS